MATATERIPVLVTKMEKLHIAAMAKQSGLSMGEYLRRAAASYNSSEDDKILEGMIDQMVKTTVHASAAIDDALQFVEDSNQRMAVLEAQQKRAH